MHTYWKLVARISPIFRKRRLQKFVQIFKPRPETRILDVGGLPRFWTLAAVQSQITIVNLDPLDEFEASFLTSNHDYVIGDATGLGFADHQFDVVFSNSVIEHLGAAKQQIAMAREIRRVGKAYWVQTPAKEFPIEPHYFTPFVHWLPKHWQRRLLRNGSLWGLLRRPDQDLVDMAVNELRLLCRQEMKTLFPDADIWIERLLGVPKSYSAYRLSPTHSPS